MDPSVPLVDLAPTLQLLALAAVIALLPLSWWWLRQRRAAPADLRARGGRDRGRLCRNGLRNRRSHRRDRRIGGRDGIRWLRLGGRRCLGGRRGGWRDLRVLRERRQREEGHCENNGRPGEAE